jgi:signal transduction histidine kinase
VYKTPVKLLLRAWPYLAIGATLTLGVMCLTEAMGAPAPQRFAGFLTYESGAVASLARADWPGFSRGLAVRDVIVEVGGVPVRGGAAVARRLAELPPDTDVAIAAVSASGVEKRVTLPVGHLGRADLGYTFALPFSIGVLYLLLGSVIFLVKRDLSTTLTLVLCLTASAFYLTMFDAHTDYHFTRVWISYPLLGPLSVHLFAVFPERRPRWARPAVLGALYAVGLCSIAWRQAVLTDPAGADRASLFSSIMLATEFLIDLGLLGYTFRGAGSPAVRNRAKTTFVGMALTMSVVIVWQFASRRALAGPPVMTADRAMLCSAAFPLLIAYALLRRNLFDIDAVLRASVIYGLATALVLGLYFAAVAVLSGVAAPLLSRFATRSAAAVASTLVVAAVFHPLRLRVQRFVDRLLLSDRRAAAEELAALAEALPAAGDPVTIADDVVRRLARLVGARGVALLVPGQRGELEVVAQVGALPDGAASARIDLARPLGRELSSRDRPLAVRDLAPEAAGGDDAAALGALGADLLVPLRARGQLVGLIALAPRRAAVYRFADLKALEQAAPPVALALDHARLAAERAARERLAALGSMAAVIVHEVKNPLGIIKVSAGTLRKRVADDASAELLRCVEDEVDRMDAVCRRLLELARPPASAKAPCDLAEVVRSTVDRLRPDLDAAQVRVTCDLPNGEPRPALRADADALRQVLINLVYNARDSMREGGGELTIRVEPRPGVLVLSVADTGRGMDESIRRQLFRPFFTTRHGGTGLGLAIVKRIVEEHEGAVHVDSRPGEGSRFTITLPV